MVGDQVLGAARAVLVVDWPSREVPEALARAGLDVVVHGGPGPEDYTEHRLEDDDVVVRRRDRPPERADVVYSHRPLEELPEIVELGRALGAHAVWLQSGLSAPGVKDPTGCWMAPEESRRAREVVESAGMAYVDDSYIVDAARRRSRG